MNALAESLIADIPPELAIKMEAEFRRGWHMEAVKAEVIQKAIGQKNHRDGTLRSVDGLGRLRLRIDGSAYHYWGQRLGYQCWNDPQFVREFERDNPACKVDSGGTRIQSGYGGLK